MNSLNDWFQTRHCASGSREDYLLLCCNGITVDDLNGLCLQISYKVSYRHPGNGSLAIAEAHVYIPLQLSWGKVNVPFWFNHCLDDQFWNATFDLQRLKLWMLFTRHTSMAYDKWEWKIDCWLIKSTQHSLPSLPWPSTIVCWPGKQASFGFCQSLVQEVEHNLSVIQERLIPWLIMHAQMYFFISTQTFVLPCQMFELKR